MNARKLRGFTAVSSCSSYVFNINKTNASPLLSYVVRGVEHMFKKKKTCHRFLTTQKRMKEHKGNMKRGLLLQTESGQIKEIPTRLHIFMYWKI